MIRGIILMRHEHAVTDTEQAAGSAANERGIGVQSRRGRPHRSATHNERTVRCEQPDPWRRLLDDWSRDGIWTGLGVPAPVAQ